MGDKSYFYNNRILNKLFISFYFIAHWACLLSGPDPENIKSAALDSFDLDLPGFKYTITHACTPGDWFELEAALYAEHILLDPVAGLRLAIEFNKPSIIIPSDDNQTTELRSTEFDIITAQYAIECKSSCHNKKSYEKAAQQICKEVTMLAWLKKISDDIAKKNISITHHFERSKRRFTKPKSIFTIKGPCTLGQNVQFYCSWVDQEASEQCIEQLKSIVTFMAHKTLLVLFKTYIPEALIKNLEKKNIAYRADVEYEEKQDDAVADLQTQFDALQLEVYT
jgi:hypothetical protein